MVTVPEVVEEIIRRSPFLEEGLSQGIVNLSSLARQIQPEIRQRLFKDIQEGAIVMALKRYSQDSKTKKTALPKVMKAITDISVRSNLAEFTFTNSETLISKQRQLLDVIHGRNNTFFTFTQGVYETSLFISLNIQDEVEKIFSGEVMKNKALGLSAITLILPQEAMYTPGVYYSILKSLAWEGINFVEVVSSFTELTILLEDKDVDHAFSVLKKGVV